MKGFNQMSDGIKKGARDFKDFGDAGTKVVSALSAKFSNDLTVAVGGAFNVVTEMAKGGIWGAMSLVVSKTVDFMVAKWKEAEEASRRYGEIIRTAAVAGMEALGAKASDVSARLKEAAGNADGALKALDSKVDHELKYNLKMLALDRAQQVIGGISDEGLKVLDETNKLKENLWKANGEVEKAAAREAANNARLEELQSARAEVEDRVSEAEKQRADFVDRYAKKLERHAELQAKAAETEAQMVESGMGLLEARRKQKENALALADFEKDNKGILEAKKKLDEGVLKIEAEVAKIDQEILAQNIKLNDSARRLELANLDVKVANEELAAQKRRAAAATAAATKATENEEIAELESARQLEWQNKIYEVAKKAKIESGELINRLNELMEDGCEDEEIRHELNQKFAEIMERRNKAEEEATAAAEKDAKDKKSGKSPGGGTSTHVAVDIGPAAAAAIGQGVDQKLGWQEKQKQARQEQRQQRDMLTEQKRDITPMARYLRGDMPRGQKALFEQYMTQKYGPKQIKEIGKAAMDAQLLSKSEAKLQQKKIVQMADEVAKALTVR